MSFDLLLVFLVFVFFSVIRFINEEKRRLSFSRKRTEWLLDTFNLLVQGLFVPVLQVLLVSKIFHFLIPNYAQAFHLGALGSFLLNFLVIDYAYYWNHRALHSKFLWNLHRVHHSARFLDIWITSRNSLVTVLFLVYLWGQGLVVYLLSEPKYFLLACAVSASLDLWRHTQMNMPALLARLLGTFLILPKDHAWHHSTTKSNFNFGANLNIWDKIHGTFYHSETQPEKLGFPIASGFIDQFLFPWRIK